LATVISESFEGASYALRRRLLGGFEGDVVEDQTSPFFGKRMVGGWRLENLPWTYEMSQKLIYQRDLKGLTNK